MNTSIVIAIVVVFGISLMTFGLITGRKTEDRRLARYALCVYVGLALSEWGVGWLAAPYWVELVVSIAGLVLMWYGAILGNIEIWRRWKRYRLAKSG